jgi:branched-chain amino acid transport system substrate-binding protein
MLEVAGNARPLFQRGFKYLFTTLRPADELADPYFRLLVKELPQYGMEPPKTIAVIAPDAPFYVSAAQGFKNYAEKYGLEVVHYEVFPVDLTDLTPILQKIKAKQPDLIAMGSHTVPAMMLMRTAKEIDFNPKAYLFSFGTHIPEFIKELGKDAEYVLEYVYGSPGAPYKDYVFGSMEEFIEAFKAKTGMYPDGTQECAWAAGIALETAFKKAGVVPPLDESEREKLRDALATLDIVTAAGPVKFSPEGFNTANPLGIDQIQNGQFVAVSPPEWATGKIIYPTPPWKERG